MQTSKLVDSPLHVFSAIGTYREDLAPGKSAQNSERTELICLSACGLLWSRFCCTEPSNCLPAP